MSNARTQVVVVGAGYAGVMATNRLLATHPDLAVTVVNRRPVFVERVRLHQVAAGTGTATHDLTTLLHPRAELHVGTAARIDDDAVLLDDGTVLPYDVAVYAVGSGPGRPAVPGGERAYAVSDLESATALRTALSGLPAGAAVTVVGAGLTGIEVASELAEAHPGPAYTLVGDPGRALPEGTRRYLRRTLAELGVEVRPGVVTRITADSVQFDDGTEARTDLVVWAGGFSVPDLARGSGLPVDDTGRLRVDDTLRSVDGRAVVGIGDAVTVAGQDHIRMSCQAAMPLGKHGADTVSALLQGRTPAPLSLGFVAQCISLGRSRGALQFTHPDDTPRNVAVRGRLGAFAKETIVRGTIWAMPREARSRAFRLRGGSGIGRIPETVNAP
ncbi:NAD(P)/FAD-dependent oxidoreductase [Rhodococcus chondri]|uniref:FAD-dependent oxidoreductase n=1 Tax=Rhodococcus chondri TaxID=3065941 RepID=A0ABU7JNF4_9NOCA|nr:FAD-dependent oxidoreductase [Rhodococcus sp. CC-R104]MEE2031571.1 FAD-dependent oxidoreductase [Rhodococcus sp. CC-R104]